MIIDNPHAVAAEIGKTINSIPVTENVIEDVVAIITKNQTILILYLTYYIF